LRVEIYWKEGRDTSNNFRLLKNVRNVSIDNKHKWIDFLLDNNDIRNKDYGDFKLDEGMKDGDSFGVQIKKDDNDFDHIEIMDDNLKFYTKEQIVRKALLEEQRRLDIKYLVIGKNGIYPSNMGNELNADDSLESYDGKRQIQLCEDWIKKFCSKTHPNIGIVKRRSSYGFKHKVERYYRKEKGFEFDNYVSNGAFIQAAINLQYEVKRTDLNSPNVYLNIVIINKKMDIKF